MPVIPTAIAVTERAREGLLIFVTLIIRAPMNRILQHGGFKRLADLRQLVFFAPAQYFSLNRAQGEDGLTIGESEPRPDFQNCKMIFHQLRESAGGLIVGRMCFVRKATIAGQCRREALSLNSIVVRDFFLSE